MHNGHMFYIQAKDLSERDLAVKEREFWID